MYCYCYFLCFEVSAHARQTVRAITPSRETPSRGPSSSSLRRKVASNEVPNTESWCLADGFWLKFYSFGIFFLNRGLDSCSITCNLQDKHYEWWVECQGLALCYFLGGMGSDEWKISRTCTSLASSSKSSGASQRRKRKPMCYKQNLDTDLVARRHHTDCRYCSVVIWAFSGNSF